jgi:hypothetical protein
MFITLLIVTFVIAVLVTVVVSIAFNSSIARILERIFSEPIAAAWQRYVMFAIYVVGIPGGVRIWELEKYITPRGKDEPALVLNMDRWTLEVYRTIIETLQSIAWLLLVFFAVALFAYIIVRVSERQARVAEAQAQAAVPSS